MLTVHHLNNSRSQRILWMLEELTFDYKVELYQRRPDMFAPDELKRVHPLGKSPIVEDANSDGERVVLVETGAICEYLIDKAAGRLGPSAVMGNQLRYRQFLHYAEGSVMPVLFALLVVSQVPLLGGLAVRRVRPLLDIHLDHIEHELSSRDWFAGDEFTAADIMMSFPLEAVKTRGWLGARRSTITWLNRIHARPAYVRALEKGGPYVFAR